MLSIKSIIPLFSIRNQIKSQSNCKKSSKQNSFLSQNSKNLSHDLKTIIIKYIYLIMAVNVHIQDHEVVKPDIPETMFFSSFLYLFHSRF